MKERLDALREKDIVQKFLHINRYEFSASVINKFSRSKNERILDIACGFGYGSSILHRKTGLNVLGVDINEETVSYARKWYGKEADFLAGDITAINLPKNSFDFIVSVETIEHLYFEDSLKALQNLRTLLKPAGILIVSSPNSYSSYWLYKMFEKNPFHLYEFSPRELKRILTDLHFEIYLNAGQYIFNPVIFPLIERGLVPSWYFNASEKIPPILARYFVLVAKNNKNM